jgi:hypothetical protein
MQASAAGHTLTYLITLKLKLVTATMFKSLIIPMHVWHLLVQYYVHLDGFSPRVNYTDRVTAACWRS